MTAKLAKPKHCEALRIRPWHPLFDCGGNRHIQRPVRKIGQGARHLFERPLSRKIGERDGQRRIGLGGPQPGCDGLVRIGHLDQRLMDHRLRPGGQRRRHRVRAALHQPAEIGRPPPRRANRRMHARIGGYADPVQQPRRVGWQRRRFERRQDWAKPVHNPTIANRRGRAASGF